MYLLLWIAVAGLLPVLPLGTASPVTPSSNRNDKPTKQSAADACSNPSSAGMTSSCWTQLKMNDYFSNWTNKTILPNAPMIGTIYCRPNEVWAQCFIRFAYGQQRQARAPMDCATLGSSNCKAPSDMLIKPTSPEYWYGAYAIYAIFTYINTLASALLSTTARPGVLQSAYTSANAGAGAASGVNPIDATLFQLLFVNGLTDMDVTFATYMKQSPYTGDFSGATTDPPSDEMIYRNLVAVLQQRLQKLMNGWDSFKSVLGTGSTWTTQVQGAGDFVSKWTSTAQARV
ncbi:MAG: hypothetical protein Q9225_005152 [Loekoesia sp. 1 TL-2023]